MHWLWIQAEAGYQQIDKDKEEKDSSPNLLLFGGSD